MKRGLLRNFIITISSLFIIGIIALFWIFINDKLTLVYPQYNILVIIYGSLNSQHVSHLGYGKKTTPMLDTLASQGISFRDAVTVSSQIDSSIFSIITGMYPLKHRQNDGNFCSIQTLPEILSSNGYITAAFINGEEVSSDSACMHGFDKFVDNGKDESISTVLNQALHWMKENSNKKLFAIIYGNDLKDDFPIPKNYKGEFFPLRDLQTRFQGTREEYNALKRDLENGIIPVPEDILYWTALYDSRIWDVDSHLSLFWKEFSQMDLFKKTIVIILSGNGTELYEHYRFGSGQSIYDEQVRVPLVIFFPDLLKGKSINEQVSTIDITPTILDILKIPVGRNKIYQFHGKSLIPLTNGKQFVLQDVFLKIDDEKIGRQYGIRTSDGWKFIFSSSGWRQLYDLKNDPAELKNLAEPGLSSENTERIFDLEWKIRNHLEEIGADPYDL